MDEFAIVKKYMPLKDNLDKYLTVRTKVNCFDDLEFSMANQLNKTVRKFSHSGWTEMKDIVVGIKCYTKREAKGTVWVQHTDRAKNHTVYIDTLEVEDEIWVQFKYPLLDTNHTDTRILLSDEVTAFTLAIMNTATRVRHDVGTNEFPSQLYKSIGDKAVVYVDENGRSFLPDDAYPAGIEKVLIVPSATSQSQ
jgi:hypothetical protein